MDDPVMRAWVWQGKFHYVCHEAVRKRSPHVPQKKPPVWQAEEQDYWLQQSEEWTLYLTLVQLSGPAGKEKVNQSWVHKSERASLAPHSALWWQGKDVLHPYHLPDASGKLTDLTLIRCSIQENRSHTLLGQHSRDDPVDKRSGNQSREDKQEISCPFSNLLYSDMKALPPFETCGRWEIWH